MGRKIRFSFLLLCVCVCVRVCMFECSRGRVKMKSRVLKAVSMAAAPPAACSLAVCCEVRCASSILLSPVEVNAISSTQATAQRQYGAVQLQPSIAANVGYLHGPFSATANTRG